MYCFVLQLLKSFAIYLFHAFYTSYAGHLSIIVTNFVNHDRAQIFERQKKQTTRVADRIIIAQCGTFQCVSIVLAPLLNHGHI